MARKVRRSVELPADLDQAYLAGRLPWPLGRALSFPEACAVVQALPAVTSEHGGLPRGYGVMPPVNAEPVVKLGKAVRDGYGKAIPTGSEGVVGCMWRRGDQVVTRLWFRGLDEAGHQGKALRGPVDVYPDAIGAVRGLGGQVPQLTGWEIVRLDHGAPETQAELGAAASGLVDAHGRAFTDADPEGGGGGGDYEELQRRVKKQGL